MSVKSHRTSLESIKQLFGNKATKINKKHERIKTSL